MSRSVIPFTTPDVSALARSLREQLAQCDHAPSHLEMLNMLARAIGQRNFQSLRAQLAAADKLRSEGAPPEPVDHVQLLRTARHFDVAGCLISWPAKTSLRDDCLWVLWSQLPPRQSLTETELNRRLRALHSFGDHALLRRDLCDAGLVARTPDGRDYRRVERRPPAQAAALIHHLSPRMADRRAS